MSLAFHFEALESRIALSAMVATAPDVELLLSEHVESEQPQDQQFDVVTVTPTTIITPADTIPRFAADPTNVAVRSGNWNNPTIWSSYRVPTIGDRVSISAGTVVDYSSVRDVHIDSLEISGSLVFSTTQNTRLIVANLTVMPNGLLQIGTADAPVKSGVTAEIVIADKPLDLVNDPFQFGTGLIALGTVSIHGAELGHTWSHLAAEPRAGDTSLLMADDVSDWQPGDTIVLPDTRQVSALNDWYFDNGKIPPQWEEVVVDHVEGSRVFLKAALQFDHLGARNNAGQLELLPDAALLNRNVVIRSENANGTRGHTLFTARADVDVEYARFQDLGRTDALVDIDNTQRDADGNITHVGTNQIGRYAVHFHHLIGPVNPLNRGYQYRLVGNTVIGSKKWGVTVHGTNFGLVDQNVVYDAQGAGIATEDGTEIGNQFTNNITIRIQGTHVDGKSGTDQGNYGRGGSGFWFRRGGNVVSGNVAADSTYAGFVVDGYFLDVVRYPLFRGADKRQPDQGYSSAEGPSTLFTNNVAYGMTPIGMWIVQPNGNPQAATSSVSYFSGNRIWHVNEYGFIAYYTSKLTLNNMLILGDRNALDRNDAGGNGMYFGPYSNLDLVIVNSRIENYYQGIVAPAADASVPGIERPTIIRDSTLKNYINVVVSPAQVSTTTAGNVLEVRNVKFQMIPIAKTGPYPGPVRPSANIATRVIGENLNYVFPSVVRVYDYNQVPGDNFQVYYNEQAASYVLPQTEPALNSRRSSGVVGAPVAGLTNAQAWQRYGLAFAGALAPSNAVSRSDITGLVAPIATPADPPRIAIITPWTGAVVTGSYIYVRYNLIGPLPAGAIVFYQLDHAAPLTSLDATRIGGVTVGSHTLRIYIGDSSGKLWPGTTPAVSSFYAYY